MSDTPQEIGYYKCFVDGEWIDGDAGRIDVSNPANDVVWAQVPSCSVEQAEAALKSCEKAQAAWQALTPMARADYLYAICDKLAERKELFAKLLVMEQGKTLNEAEFEVDDTIRYIKYACEAARRIEGQIFPADAPREQLLIHKVPYGVTVGLCAFNYPLALIGRKIGPALVTGNTMVLKPHEVTPVTACEFCKVVEDAGLPKGVINMVIGTGAEIGSALVSNTRTRLVTMTGSIPAGQAIYKTASDNVAKLVLELGGKAPFIVLADADLDAAAEAAVPARFVNCGQVCICNEMILVEESVAEEFTAKVIEKSKSWKCGDPMKNDGMGPSTTQRGLDRVDAIVKKTIEEGATLVTGGKRPEGPEFEKGNWYEPTILTNVTTEMSVFKEEMFAPIMPIVKISGYDEALSLCNDREEGLSAYLWTQNYSTMMDAVERMEVGTIFINKGMTGAKQGYHSGHKRSGIGGEDGVHGLEEYLQKRVVYLKY